MNNIRKVICDWSWSLKRRVCWSHYHQGDKLTYRYGQIPIHTFDPSPNGLQGNRAPVHGTIRTQMQITLENKVAYSGSWLAWQQASHYVYTHLKLFVVCKICSRCRGCPTDWRVCIGVPIGVHNDVRSTVRRESGFMYWNLATEHVDLFRYLSQFDITIFIIWAG